MEAISTSNTDPVPECDQAKNSSGGAKTKYIKKVEEGFGRLKEKASNGVNRVKIGAHLGPQWIKDKYHNKTNTKQ